MLRGAADPGAVDSMCAVSVHAVVFIGGCGLVVLWCAVSSPVALFLALQYEALSQHSTL